MNCIAFSAADGKMRQIGLDAVEIPAPIIYALARIGDKKVWRLAARPCAARPDNAGLKINSKSQTP
ncbi:MAG: hypothetical protein ABSH38_08295 [Verrucomicrobiota bacterium]